jgi:nitrogen fixation protein FixH
MTLLRSIFQPKQFTGKHMLFSMVAFFGVIIAVNLTMARFAVTTWSGLVVPNTYVASQQFNAKAEESRTIEALGYQVDFQSDPDGVSVILTDSGGQPVEADTVTAGLRRPVGTLDDRELEFTARGPGVYTVAGRLAEGAWIAHVTAIKDGTTIYQKARRFHVRADASLRP